MRNLLSDHLSQSTAHGVSNIFKYHRLSIRMFWCVMTVIFVVFFICHSSILIYILKDEKIHISQTPSLPFVQPDVVICFFPPYSFDYINNPPEEDYKFMKKVAAQVNDIYNRTTDLNKLRLTSSVIFDTVGLRDLKRAFFHRNEQLIVSLSCNGTTDLSIPFETNFHSYSCLRLKPEDCSLATDEDYLTATFYMHTYTGNKKYPRTIDVNLSRRFFEIALPNTLKFQEMSDGISIFFTDKNHHTDKRGKHIIAQSNFETVIKVNSKHYTFQKRKRFQCSDDNTFQLYYNLQEDNIEKNLLNFSDRSLCYEKICQVCLYKKLGCVSSILPIPVSIPKNFTLCYNISNGLSLDEIRSIDNEYFACYNEAKRFCHAQKYCEFFKFSADIQQIRWPSDSTMKMYVAYAKFRQLELLKLKKLTPGIEELAESVNSTNIDPWKENLIKIRIEKGEPMTTEIVESFAYTFSQLFSDIGGIFGFYLGASVLTLFELFSFIHEVICRKLDSKKLEKENTPKDAQFEVA